MNINKFRKTIQKKNRKKTLKKKGGADSNQNNKVPPRPRLKRETVDERREQMERAILEIDRREAALRRERDLLIVNLDTPNYNMVRVRLFDAIHSDAPFNYVNVAIQQLSDISLVRLLQSEQIPQQGTALQGILQDIVTQFQNFITNGAVTDRNEYSHIRTAISRSYISRVISELRSTRTDPDTASANLLEEFIDHVIHTLNPFGPTPIRLSSTPSSSSSSLNRGNIGGRQRKTRKKTLKKKGGGIQEIKKFLHYIVNNKYPEDVEPDDSILFGYKKDDLKYIKPLDLITLDDLETLALETTKSIEFEQELTLKRITRLHRFKMYVLELINNFEGDIDETVFPNYNRGDSFNTPPANRPRTAQNVVRTSRFANTRRPSPIQLPELDNYGS
jgi:hypothetical protein